MIGRRTIINIVSSLTVLLLTYAAVSKLADYKKFQVQIGQSPMIATYAKYVAIGVPIAELTISLMLLYSRTRLLALYASFGLMVVFTLYILAIMNFASHVPCSCGGILEGMGWREHLVFNIVVVLVLGATVILHERRLITELRS